MHTFILAVATTLLLRPSNAITPPPSFTPGVKWQIEIQNTISTKAPLKPTDALVWDIDLYHAVRNPSVIPYIRSTIPGATIICYLNAGLAQTSDCDYPLWRGSPSLGKPYSPEFPDEYWIDIRNDTAVAQIKSRITLASEIGCDGVDPDNIDGYGDDDPTGFSLSAPDYIAFIRSLAAHAHTLTTTRGHTLLIGQKNGPDLTPSIAPFLDFAVLEDCKGLTGGDNFCSIFAEHYINKGKPVFSIEYPSSLGAGCPGEGITKDEFGRVCTEDYSRFSTVLKKRGGSGELDGCTQYCGEGVGKGVVVTAVDIEADGDECKL
ncbi:hypothetical protein OQA88_9100 [Cercophora sp. LCS_1]